MYSNSVKLITLLIVGLIWSISGSLATANQLHSQRIIVNGGGQTAIEDAISQAEPGDIILVHAGDYDDYDPDTPLEIKTKGTNEAPIILKAADGTRPKLGNVKFVSAKYFIIEGFEIAHQQSFYTLEVNGKNSSNITIRDMEIHHGRFCVGVKTGVNTIIEDSKIYECVNSTGSKHQEAHGIMVAEATNTVIRNNEIYGFMADAIQLITTDPIDRGVTLIENNHLYSTKGPCAENAVDIKGELGTVIVRGNTIHSFEPMTGVGCQYIATGSSDGVAVIAHLGSKGTLIIEGNEIYDVYQGIGGPGGMTMIIRNNIFHDFNEGTYLWSDDMHLGVIEAYPNTEIYHNTFVNIPWFYAENSLGGSQVKNNLFYNVSHTTAKGKSGNLEDFVYSHNGWFGNSQQQLGSGDVAGDNPFLNADYTLTNASSVIDKGTNLEIFTDFTGLQAIRPTGAMPDIGAFEFIAAPTPEPTADPSDLPTPTPEVTTPSEPTVEPDDEPTGPVVTNLMLINADTNEEIGSLTDGTTIDFGALPTQNLSIRADTEPSTVGSVIFGLDNNANFRTENIAPYTIAGDNNSGRDYNPWIPDIGQHTLTVTPYTENGGRGTQGVVQIVTFNVVDNVPEPEPTPPVTEPGGPIVTNLILINADTDEEIGPLTDGATIDLGTLPTQNLSVRADTQPSNVGSVIFSLDDNDNLQTENILPYAIAGDQNDGRDYNPWTPDIGQHTLTVTPYTEKNGAGIQGVPLSVTFNIINSVPELEPTPATEPHIINLLGDEGIELTCDGRKLMLERLSKTQVTVTCRPIQ